MTSVERATVKGFIDRTKKNLDNLASIARGFDTIGMESTASIIHDNLSSIQHEIRSMKLSLDIKD